VLRLNNFNLKLVNLRNEQGFFFFLFFLFVGNLKRTSRGLGKVVESWRCEEGSFGRQNELEKNNVVMEEEGNMVLMEKRGKG
jgi:hypothetical protein